MTSKTHSKKILITICQTLRIQVCPKVLRKGLPLHSYSKDRNGNPQSYSREGSGFLGRAKTIDLEPLHAVSLCKRPALRSLVLSEEMCNMNAPYISALEKVPTPENGTFLSPEKEPFQKENSFLSINF